MGHLTNLLAGMRWVCPGTATDASSNRLPAVLLPFPVDDPPAADPRLVEAFAEAFDLDARSRHRSKFPEEGPSGR